MVGHHARGHRGLTHGVADVKTLEALRRFGQPQRLLQRRQTCLLVGLQARAGGGADLRIFLGHFQPHPARTDGARHDLHRVAGMRAEHAFQRLDFLNLPG